MIEEVVYMHICGGELWGSCVPIKIHKALENGEKKKG